MFVVESGEFPVIDSKMDFRRWSWPLIFSLLVNLVLFFLFASILNLSKVMEHTTTVLQISLFAENTQTKPKATTKTAALKRSELKAQIPQPYRQNTAIPPNVPQKSKNKPTEPKIQELPSPKPVVTLLQENRQTIDAQLQGDMELTPESTTKVLKPVPLFRLTRQPSGISGAPIYPEHAKALGREAYVMANIVIGIDGKITEVQIVQSGGEEFDEAVTVWLLKQRLKPGLVNDTPVVSRISQPFNFILR